jgi:hypothetical protein
MVEQASRVRSTFFKHSGVVAFRPEYEAGRADTAISNSGKNQWK